MKVAYVFESDHALFILDSMILPQLEKGNHGAQVAGMFFMFDNSKIQPGFCPIPIINRSIAT